MNQSTAYIISVENNQITLQLNASLIDQGSLTKLLDFIELESIRKSSQLNEAEAELLADEVNRAAWQVTKEKFLET
jgi:hypothetical protein